MLAGSRLAPTMGLPVRPWWAVLLDGWYCGRGTVLPRIWRMVLLIFMITTVMCFIFAKLDRLFRNNQVPPTPSTRRRRHCPRARHYCCCRHVF